MFLVYNLFFNISNISSAVSIDMQPKVFLPKFNSNNEIQSVISHQGVNIFSIEFSINFYFNQHSNTIETIKNNYKLKETGILLYKYHKNMIDELSLEPKRIFLKINGFCLDSFFPNKSKDIGNARKGCQLISLKRAENEKITTREQASEIIKKLFTLMELRKENYSEFGFQFIIIIKKNTSIEEKILVKTNCFKVVIEDDGSYLRFEEVDGRDYFLKNNSLIQEYTT